MDTSFAPPLPSRACQLAKHDLQASRQEYIFTWPGSLLTRVASSGLLKDSRDLPQLLLLTNILLTAVPAAVCLHAFKVESHALGLLYLLVNYALYLQRFLLTLHFTEHRQLFAAGWLNTVAPYFLAPLYGVPSGAYRLHHVVMHHIEDNASGRDLSSTEAYQRDSLLAFFRYWLRFVLLVVFDLPWYALQRGRTTEAARAALSMAANSCIVLLLWRRCWVATLYTLVLPYALSSLAMMFGNWSQHIFINPATPADDYSLTYNCLACPDNSRTYDDGYHILHHANSRTHWSELPSVFLQQLQIHDEKDALVFANIGVYEVGLAVFMGRIDYLAGQIVPCGPRQAARSKDQWVSLLQTRLQPVVRKA